MPAAMGPANSSLYNMLPLSLHHWSVAVEELMDFPYTLQLQCFTLNAVLQQCHFWGSNGDDSLLSFHNEMLKKISCHACIRFIFPWKQSNFDCLRLYSSSICYEIHIYDTKAAVENTVILKGRLICNKRKAPDVTTEGPKHAYCKNIWLSQMDCFSLGNSCSKSKSLVGKCTCYTKIYTKSIT